MSDDPNPPQMQLVVGTDVQPGVYSNLVRIWHTQFEFTLDFATLGETPNVPVVARVKVPTSVIFQIASAIAQNVDMYEQKYGPITTRTGPDGPDAPPMPEA
jgi:Protein of unknown function (DUF3467)